VPTLYPYVDRIEARRFLGELEQGGIADFTPRFSSPKQEYSTSGGTRVTQSALRELRAKVENIARATGWPTESSLETRRRFDRDLARYLHEHLGMTPHEASRPEVWQFLCCFVFADIVAWRFPSDSERTVEARFFGGNRNALGRLWWRAEILRDEESTDPYRLLDLLMEDELVQIMERPSIARCRPVARALAKGFLDVFAAKDKRGERLGRMELMRDAAKRILRTGAIIAFEVLNEEQAGAIAKIELARACEALLQFPVRQPELEQHILSGARV
jgi:hypothetical protein